jgi:signal transduction histidine kinase/DNA-binding NarL/FixJ family response regulator
LTLSWKLALNEQDRLIYATATDITDKLAVEEKLIQSRVEMEKARAKDDFLANMSHEIRTPLNAITGFHELLSKTKLDQEQARYADIISSALKNLNVIINDILDLSKLENGKLQLEKRAFKIEAFVKQLIQLNMASAKAKNLKLILSYDSDIPEWIVGDEIRLTQILMNLISNAVKFTPQGSIEVRVTEVKRSKHDILIRFSVKDTGIGIAPDKLEMVFDRFTQAENYTTREYGGTGLGLNIVKSLVDLYQGKMEVSSQPDKGSEFAFEITFPLAKEENHDSEKLPSEQMQQGDLSGVHILLVEDNIHNQILAKTYLEKNNATVDIAGNGMIALNKLRENDYSLIILDVQMPVMDGLTTTKNIRENLKNDIVIIGCSAHSLNSEKIACLEAGMNDYITKPYSENDLVHAVIRNLSKKEIIPSKVNKESVYTEEFKHALLSLEADLGKDNIDTLKEELYKRIPSDLGILSNCLQKKHYDDLKELSHDLRGTFSAMQLKSGHEITSQLESACKEGDTEMVFQLVPELVKYLKILFTETEKQRSAK